MSNYIYIPKAKIPIKMLQHNISNYIFMLNTLYYFEINFTKFVNHIFGKIIFPNIVY